MSKFTIYHILNRIIIIFQSERGMIATWSRPETYPTQIWSYIIAPLSLGVLLPEKHKNKNIHDLIDLLP